MLLSKLCCALRRSAVIGVFALSACGGGNSGSSPTGAGPAGGGTPGGGGGSSPGSGSTFSPFWIPYLAAPVSGSTSGSTGIFVVPSNALTTAPTFVTAKSVPVSSILARTYRNNLTGSTFSSSSPYSLVYAAPGDATTQVVQLYGLDLSDLSTVPAPRQIGNFGSLSVPLTSEVCIPQRGQTNLNDPTTLFLVLHVPGPRGNCFLDATPGDAWYLVNYTDSAATAPVPLPIAPSALYPINNPSTGLLSAIVAWKQSTGSVSIYTDTTFTKSTTVLANGVTSVFEPGLTTAPGKVPGLVYFVISTASGQSLWQISFAGVAIKLYAAHGILEFSGAADDDNFYFTDSAANGETYILQEPQTGGVAPMVLYQFATDPSYLYWLVGANDSVVAYSQAPKPGSAATQSTLWTVPVGAPSTTARQIASVTGEISFGSFMIPSTLLDASTNRLLVNVKQSTGTGPAATVSYSSEILDPNSGAALQTLTSNSEFLIADYGGLVPSFVQLTGITDTNGGTGGATVFAVNSNSLATTPLNSGGAAYVLPQGYTASTGPLAGSSTDVVAFLSFSQMVPIGNSSVLQTLDAGAYDLSGGQIVQFHLPNTLVQPAF